MEAKEEITIPYNFIPRDYQLPLLKALDSGIKRAMIIWHRRSGKDKVCWNYMIRKAIEEKGTYYYFLPTGTQARKVVWDNIDNDGFKMLDHIPKEVRVKTNETELQIQLYNGSIIQLIAADIFEKASIGTNPRGVVFSEFSISNPNVWDYVRPVLAVNKGWAIFNYTPRGMNHAYQLWQIIKDNKDWFSELLTIENTNVLSKEDIDKEIREGMPIDMVDQEFYCKFIEGASSVFHRIDENITNEKVLLQRGKRYQIGIDLAKYQDYTVLTVIDLHTFNIARQIQFNQIDWPEQKEIIVKEAKYWNNASCWMDSTGLGDPIYDDLTRLITIRPFQFTQISREQLLNNLKIMLEQDRIKIPNDPELIEQLKSMQYELVGQRVKMNVPEGLHDDRVMSLALACWGLYERLPIKIVEKIKRKKIKTPGGISLKMTSY